MGGISQLYDCVEGSVSGLNILLQSTSWLNVGGGAWMDCAVFLSSLKRLDVSLRSIDLVNKCLTLPQESMEMCCCCSPGQGEGDESVKDSPDHLDSRCGRSSWMLGGGGGFRSDWCITKELSTCFKTMNTE